VQSGHEKTLTAVLPALAGANVIYGLGMLESGVTLDYAQLVIDAEIARMVKHVVAGVPVNDDTLAVDDIHAVGPFGDFLSLESTMRHMRELSQPRLIDRRVREDWEASGGEDAYTAARREARRLLAEHRPPPLPDDVLAGMQEIVTQAEVDAGAGS
jgi:trimethylamine--corrinoid protein Co-methyltransferase